MKKSKVIDKYASSKDRIQIIYEISFIHKL